MKPNKLKEIVIVGHIGHGTTTALSSIIKEPKNYLTGKKLPKLNKNKKRKK